MSILIIKHQTSKKRVARGSNPDCCPGKAMCFPYTNNAVDVAISVIKWPASDDRAVELPERRIADTVLFTPQSDGSALSQFSGPLVSNLDRKTITFSVFISFGKRRAFRGFNFLSLPPNVNTPIQIDH
jgi:hypothetical protein